MRRYPQIDPPEYVDWRPDPELTAQFGARTMADPERAAVIQSMDGDHLLSLYQGMLRCRLLDYELKRWVKRGVISKAWLGTGEEAVTVGAVHALDRERDVVAPMIRNNGALHEMGMPMEAMFGAYLGTLDSPSGGRDLHAGDLARGVIQPVSPVGQMVPVVTGMALAFKQRGEPRVALTWVGDGTTKTTALHEGLNLAAVLGVPAVFILQNNQVALGTRLDQHQIDGFDAWPDMYGVAGLSVDGNNVLDVFAATRLAAQRARTGGGPALLLVETFRMGGHATHDEAEARRTFPDELFRSWGARDPIGCYEQHMLATGITEARLTSVEDAVIQEVEASAERALEAREKRMPDGAGTEFEGVSAGVRQPGLAFRVHP